MKKFALICENEHEFEGWFVSSDAVLLQSEKGLIDCPYCSSVKVAKQLAAPNLSTPKTKARQQSDIAKVAGAQETPTPIATATPTPSKQILQMLVRILLKKRAKFIMAKQRKPIFMAPAQKRKQNSCWMRVLRLCPCLTCRLNIKSGH